MGEQLSLKKEQKSRLVIINQIRCPLAPAAFLAGRFPGLRRPYTAIVLGGQIGAARVDLAVLR
jgi:hypothetical protein